MTKFFINHPIPAVVLSIILVLMGILAALELPIAEYPQIAPPTINVSTQYVGANASVVNDTVAQIIEEQIVGIDNFDYMNSFTDSFGNYSLNIFFKFGMDENEAAIQVQNKIQEVMSNLPSSVQNSGVTVSKGSTELSLLVVLDSPNGTYDNLFLRNYSDTYIIDKIKRTSGVGKVEIFSGEYAMRIWLDPEKVAEHNLTIDDIKNSIIEQSSRHAIGASGKFPTTKIQEKEIFGNLENVKETPADFENIIVRDSRNTLVHLKDIARVEEGERIFDYKEFYSGRNVAGFSVILNNSANTLETIGEIKKILEEAQKNFPPDMDYKIIIDSTVFIQESLSEVSYTFLEALALVVIIILIFLQNPRSTIISLLAIPVSLIATFIFFVPLHFTINTLTIFAMILAIGLVVDDAIVVIEIVERNLEKGIEIKKATLEAMEEVQKPILAIACVMTAVFLPIAMTEGITGELYKQFALTIVISMALSSFTALSLTPALCVLILKNHTKKESAFIKFFARIENFYGNILKYFMQRKILAIVILILVTAGTVQLYKILPSEYVPDEDKGSIFVAVNLPPGTSLNRTIETLNKLSNEINKLDEVEDSATDAGTDLISDGATSGSAGVIYSFLKNWDERDKDIWEVMEEISNVAAETAPEANVFAMTSSSLPGLDYIGNISMQMLDMKNLSDEELMEVVQKLSLALENREELSDIEIPFHLSTPYMNIKVDEDKAKLLGVNLDEVYTALEVNFGGSEISDFTRFGRNHKIVLQADTNYRDAFENTKFIFVKNSDDELVPLNTLVNLESSSGVSTIYRHNGMRCLKFDGNVAQGHSIDEAMKIIEDVVEEIAPQTFQIEWAGMSRQIKLSKDTTLEILFLSVAFVFLCLVALYESWTLPFAVLLSVPAGIFGAIFAEILTENLNSVYTQIGILVIIGLTAKNAILIVEFAKDRMKQGEKTFDAAVNAAIIRLRPILMTSLAFIVACIPLAMASGAGSAARNGMGSAVIGGMLCATIFGIFIVPILFKIIVDRSLKK